MRICYLMLVHHKFDQALRLVGRLAGPNSSFVVHVDRAAEGARAAAFRARLQPFSPVLHAKSVSSRWGAFHQALAIMRCVQTAVRHMESCDRYVLLSGQDYPIASRVQIVEFFAKHGDAEFIEAYPQDVADATAPGWSPYYRFRRYHMWVGDRHLTVPVLRKGPPPLPIFHGSTWWALTRDAMKYIAEQFDANRQLRRYLRHGFLVDEVYIPTLVMGSPFSSRVTGANVTFAKWTSNSGPHPTVLGIDDLEEILTSPKLFARKFDATIDGSVMDELDVLHEAKQTIASPDLKELRGLDPARRQSVFRQDPFRE
jgi:hypothetical protein